MQKTTTPPSERTIVVKAGDVKRRPGDLKRLRAQSRKPVDIGDPGPLTEADLRAGKARIVRRQPPRRKISLTLRLDEEVVRWFKDQGEGYQTRINEALREHKALAAADDDPAAALERIKVLAEKVRRRVAS